MVTSGELHQLVNSAVMIFDGETVVFSNMCLSIAHQDAEVCMWWESTVYFTISHAILKKVYKLTMVLYF